MKKKLSEMNDKELRDYILEQRSEMRAILDASEVEARDLTADEQSKFDELKKSAEVAESRQIANLRPLPIKEGEEKKEVRKVYDIFGENLRNAVTNGGKAKIEVRENVNVNIDSADIAGTIPVLFQDVIDAHTPALIIEKACSKMLFIVQGQPTLPTGGDV